MNSTIEPSYGLLTDVCKRYGISKTRAFDLARRKLLDSFMMNGRRYVWISSVESLPSRMGVSTPPSSLTETACHFARCA